MVRLRWVVCSGLLPGALQNYLRTVNYNGSQRGREVKMYERGCKFLTFFLLRVKHNNPAWVMHCVLKEAKTSARRCDWEMF